MEKIRARLYGGSEHYGPAKDFKVVDRLPDDVEPVRLDPEQRTGDDNKIGNYDFYLSGEGYVCYKSRKNDEDIVDETIADIKKLKARGGNPLQLAKGINSIHSSFVDKMRDSGYDDNMINFSWEYVSDTCELTNI